MIWVTKLLKQTLDLSCFLHKKSSRNYIISSYQQKIEKSDAVRQLFSVFFRIFVRSRKADRFARAFNNEFTISDLMRIIFHDLFTCQNLFRFWLACEQSLECYDYMYEK